MRPINHLVLAGHDLEAMRAAYQDLGFTVAPRGQHPFGTANHVIQLHGAYLELLAVTRAQDVIEHGDRQFSFSAFHRDYLARHEGFSAFVLGTPDAHADHKAWQAAGLHAYEPFDFSRMATLPGGEDVRVGFTIAFVSDPALPWIGMFACQHFRPDYYEQPQYLKHANSATNIEEVWIACERPDAIRPFLGKFMGGDGTAQGSGRIDFPTPTGSVVLASPREFEQAFGLAPPHPQDGPHLAALVVGCQSLEPIARRGIARRGDRHIVPPGKAFGLALAFARSTRR
ncbi:MAG TPA: VOC family protein [Hypericibacter adhaerens]|uniref:VOC family protein n=1 Tax=Hypericibacter adhaerens TaxID=2602016 RepID=UPI002C25BCFF|nr:VOC family protein [Hypericibacter adhaerens]HWA41681.1 VOC family protein [Hypericibacter adhaerens]